MENTLSSTELAKRWKMHPRTIRNWINAGKLPAIALNNCWRVKLVVIEDIERNETKYHRVEAKS